MNGRGIGQMLGDFITKRAQRDYEVEVAKHHYFHRMTGVQQRAARDSFDKMMGTAELMYRLGYEKREKKPSEKLFADLIE